MATKATKTNTKSTKVTPKKDELVLESGKELSFAEQTAPKTLRKTPKKWSKRILDRMAVGLVNPFSDVDYTYSTKTRRKVCKCCQEPKTKRNYHKNKNTKDGLDHTCKVCKSNRVKDVNRRRREKREAEKLAQQSQGAN